MKSKDIKTLNKEKDLKILQKLERMKNEILNQKVNQLLKPRQDEKPKNRMPNGNIQSGRVSPVKITP